MMTKARSTFLKETFGRSFQIFALLTVIAGVVVYVQHGWDVFSVAIVSNGDMIGYLVPNLMAALLIGIFLQQLLPPDFLASSMGHESGLKGIALSSAAGAMTPGGPITSFPLVLALREGGTGTGQLIAYITSWSTLGLQRILLWEVPLMGVEFALIRFLASLPLPFIAGTLSKYLPVVHGKEAALEPEKTP